MYNRKRKEKPKLYKLEGCRDCTRLCKFNSPIAREEVARLSNRTNFGCNNSKRKEK